ncbi:MAG: DUF86 domain-containing protein [bacterium]|nr:DUF86 domain-containing protein [bacterium]
MSRDFRDYLVDILERAERVLENTRNVRDISELENDEWTQDAVVRNLEIMGEAAKKLPDEFCKEYPQIPWKEMKGLRDRLAHQYFEISINIIWDIVKNELPVIVKGVRSIISDLDKPD